MKKIKHYRVEVTDPRNAGIIGPQKEFRVTELNVVAENDRYIAVDDFCFTSVRKEKSKYDTCLEQPKISLTANDSCWGNRIMYSLYTEKTKRASTIRKEIEAEIAKKYGFFLGQISLDFIEEKVAS